ncbi:MAG: universal stress protein, partial [Planctomycetota bacterium]
HLVLAAATKLARKEDAEVHLVHIAAPDPDFVPYDAGPQVVREQVAEDLREEHRELQQLAADLCTAGVHASARMVQGTTVGTILELAKKDNADCIVMGTHGHGALHRLVLGSVAEGVIRAAQCPVLVVPVRVAK